MAVMWSVELIKVFVTGISSSALSWLCANERGRADVVGLIVPR